MDADSAEKAKARQVQKLLIMVMAVFIVAPPLVYFLTR